MTHFEVGINNQILLWQAHFLSESCARAIHALINEPILNPATDVKTPFEIVREKGISWRWAKWQKAELLLFDADNKFHTENLHTGNAAEILFTDCSDAAQIELKLEDVQENTSAVKLLLPVVMRIGAVEILKTARGNAVIVRVTDKTKVNDLQVEKLLARSPFFSDGTFTFQPNKRQIDVPIRAVAIGMVEPFFLVVSVQTNEGRKILRRASIDYDGSLSFENGIPNDELERLRLWTEGAKSGQPKNHSLTFADWLDNWTQFSQKKLLELKQLAENTFKLPADKSENYLQTYPTGLARCLILEKLGCHWVKENLSRYLKTLNHGDFFNAVKAAEPILSGVLDYLPNNSEVILWAIRNAKHPLLVSAVKNTADMTIEGLEREFHLLKMRASGISARNERQKTKTA